MTQTLTLGQKIRELRIQKGLTQSDLGAGLVTPSMISQIESDKAHPSHKLLCGIAEKLDAPVEFFLVDVQNQLELQSRASLARALMEAGQHQKAIDMFESLLEYDSPYLEASQIKSDLANSYQQIGEMNRAAVLYEDVLEHSVQEEKVHTKMTTLNRLGHVYFKQHNLTLCLYYWKKAYHLFDKMNEPDQYARAQVALNLGRVYQQLGDPLMAMEYFGEAHDMLNGVSDFESLAHLYTTLGQSLWETQDYKKSTDYSLQAISVFKSLRNIKLSIEVKMQHAVLLGKQGNREAALRVLNQCKEEYLKHKFVQEAAGVEGEIGRLLLESGELEAAMQTVAIGVEQVSTGTTERASLLQVMGEIEKAQGNIEQAIEWFERAISEYERLGMTVEVTKLYSTLGEVYKSLGDYESATECLQRMKHKLEVNLKEYGIVL